MTGLWILPENMIFALAAQHATMAAKVPEKTFSLHPTITGSCLASGGKGAVCHEPRPILLDDCGELVAHDYILL